ncbi:MAG TPA: cold shock domain-containing protein [Polyangiaceae bacterium]|nr:cold shock domain-containing protein [Polyangiaceae bacterium]
MAYGVLKSFNGKRGFGCITPYSGRDLYFHGTAIQNRAGPLEPRTRVEFDLDRNHRGRVAVRVRAVEGQA